MLKILHAKMPFSKISLLFLLYGLLCNFTYAVSSSEVNNDLNGLISQINQVNDDLSNKQKQQKNLSKAIDDSDEAIDKSKLLLDHLKQERDLDIKQLDEIESVLPRLTIATQELQNNVKTTMGKIYKQLRLLQGSENGSILNGNDGVQSQRKKEYLIKLLQLEQQKYSDLQSKLDKLNSLNNNINEELNRVDRQLGVTTKRKSQLEHDKDKKVLQAEILGQKISKEKQQLANLRQQQGQLNKLLQNLLAMEVSAAKAAKSSSTKKSSGKQIALNRADNRYEDSSPFLSRALSKPVDNATVLVGFGEVRDTVPNNGMLFKASNSNIHAISTGRVLFAGQLPGFGQMVVVDNGDSYTSIYGGIIPSVTKGQQLTANQVIGSSGVITNQPMGGVYFELRHLGKPVNPSKLVK